MHGHGAVVAHGVTVYPQCTLQSQIMVTEAYVCEKRVQGRTRHCRGWD